MFDSKQQTGPAVIHRLPAPGLPKCLVVLEVRKIRHEAGLISSAPNIVRVAPAPMPLHAGMPACRLLLPESSERVTDHPPALALPIDVSLA
ncbi:hypothetical protein NQZ68_040183 [Dissostichus eleginoides]|nr:hypothetical protein NQZ68_040183 [Dissostichus eleginoides]